MNAQTMQDIREDMRNGMSIDDICRKYKISFHDLCQQFHGYVRSDVNLLWAKDFID